MLKTSLYVYIYIYYNDILCFVALGKAEVPIFSQSVLDKGVWCHHFLNWNLEAIARVFHGSPGP